MEERELTNIEDGKKKYSKLTYCLLAWFLGAFGVHSFYAGKPVQGIIFIIVTVINIFLSFFSIGIFTAIITGIVIIVQIIMAAKKKSDEFGRIS